MTKSNKPSGHEASSLTCCRGAIDRRRVLQGMIGVASVALAGPALADAPDALPPQPGDFLVSALGKDPLSPERIRLNAGPFEAWPQSPDGVARRGNFDNALQLFRFDATELPPEIQTMAADGVIALTVICTHAGCPATEWQIAERTLVCPCHGSRFDPKRGGALLGGPAVRKLPQLQLGLKDGKLMVAGPYDGRVGGDTTANDDH